MSNNTVEIKGRDILINGKKTQIRSGAMHYFRIHPDYWRDRIIKLRQCGLNTLETYMCWNLHEKTEGEFDFAGQLDFLRYIKIAQEEGLMVMVRPGGYICSEWDLGGLPSWLLTKTGIRFRCCNEEFLKAQDAYYRKVLPMLTPLQWDNGGPIIMMQLENEYGSWGNDHKYIAHCRDIFRECGVTVPLFTSDGATQIQLKYGHGNIPDIMPTVNGRNNPVAMVKTLDEYTGGNTPPFVMELWNGAAQNWTLPGVRHKAEDVRKDISDAMTHDINFNLYMFHGGTTFGFMNGGNGGYTPLEMPFKPLLTSYHVDATLTEAGDPTPKYFAIQEEIAKHVPEFKVEKPVVSAKKEYGKIVLTEQISLLDALPYLSREIEDVTPKTMEYYGQRHGFILYRFQTEHPGTIRLHNLKDRAVCMLNGETVAVAYRNDRDYDHAFPSPYPQCQVDILVENMGRINFGHFMESEYKGLTRVTLDYMEQYHCKVYPLPMEDVSSLPFRKDNPVGNAPAFYRGTFTVDKVCDTYFKIPCGEKGIVWINGFNLGRYWNVGPQKTLYVPAPLLKEGENEVVVFEQQGLTERYVYSQDHEDFGTPVMLPLA